MEQQQNRTTLISHLTSATTLFSLSHKLLEIVMGEWDFPAAVFCYLLAHTNLVSVFFTQIDKVINHPKSNEHLLFFNYEKF